MKLFNIFTRILIVTSVFCSCSGQAPSAVNTSIDDTALPPSTLIDSARLQSDLNEVMNGIAGGKPDTNRLKQAGSDILSTAANVLSDTGVSKLYGDNKDLSVVSAKNMLIRMRDSMGITPAALDSMKKAADKLFHR